MVKVRFLYSHVKCPMSHAILIQLVSSCVGIVGSLFFAIGIVRQNAETMALLTHTYWDWNPHLPALLAAQKADYVFGGGLILLAFALQLGSFFAPSNSLALNIPQANAAPWVAVAATVAMFLLARLAAAKLAEQYQKQIDEWLKKEQEERERLRKAKKEEHE